MKCDGVVRSPGDASALAEELEAWLGDPELDANSISFSRALELDERDELPADGIARMRSFGFHEFVVPARLGGRLRTAEDLFMLSRVVARRDMTVAVSESTQMWMMLVWIGGDAAQQARSAATVLRGGVVPCLAYSEPSHGADLAANEFRASPDGGEYVLSGKKWPINRGSTSTHVVLLGATGTDSSPARRRQSLFFVDRAQVVSGAVTGVHRVPTYGLRGCDISGVVFDNARVPASARLGAEGEGLELALRGLLVTRTFCTGLSLGAGDTMLRTVSGFLSGRMLYDGPSSEIPYAAESLANAYLSMLIAECVSLVAMRGLHLYADEFSIWANLAKVQVARLIDGNSEALARTLGARYFMRAAEHVGIFQKMLRDSAVVSIFDGSEPVCLDSIALQLSAMAKAHRQARDDDWRRLYDLRAALPDVDPAKVTVFGRGRDATFASLPALISRLDEQHPSAGCDEDRMRALRASARQLPQLLGALFGRIAEIRQRTTGPATPPPASTKNTSPELISLAEQVCDLHAKVAALGIWLFNRDHLGGFFADGQWLQAALARERVHRHEIGALEPSAVRALTDRMNAQRDNHEYFSIRTLRQAGPGAREANPDCEPALAR